MLLVKPLGLFGSIISAVLPTLCHSHTSDVQEFDLEDALGYQQRQWHIADLKLTTMSKSCPPNMNLHGWDIFANAQTEFYRYVNSTNRLSERLREKIPCAARSQDCPRFVIENHQAIYDSDAASTALHKIIQYLSNGLVTDQLRDEIDGARRDSEGRFVDKVWYVARNSFLRVTHLIWQSWTGAVPGTVWSVSCQELGRSMLQTMACVQDLTASDEAIAVLVLSFQRTLDKHRNFVELSAGSSKIWDSTGLSENYTNSGSSSLCPPRQIASMEDCCANALDIMTSLAENAIKQLCIGSVAA